jgi:hypothetical protein
MNEPLPPLPFIFGSVKKACAYAGVSVSQFYSKWLVLDPDLMIQNGERSLADLPRLIRLVGSQPRGKRKPLGIEGKGRRRRS